MQVTWNGKDITRYVNVTRCVYRDAAQGRCDSLELEFDKAHIWRKWDPQTDDRITIEHEGIQTGTVYFNTLLPYKDGYRMIATSVPSSARAKQWKSYDKLPIAAIMGQCAGECGMGAGLYGVSGGILYEYLVRPYMGCAGFMQHIGKQEGFLVKAYNSKFRLVDINWAQQQAVMREIVINDAQDEAMFESDLGKRLRSLTVQSALGKGYATDSGTEGNASKTITDLPARDDAEARRWAKNLLLWHNRQCESLTLNTDLDKQMTANARVYIKGDTDCDGYWLADEVEHDLFNMRTKAKLLRSITTIG